MSKLVVLKFGEGGWDTGFPVTLQVGSEGDRFLAEFSGKLPPAPDLPEHYDEWREAFLDLVKLGRGLQKPTTQVTNSSQVIVDCAERAKLLVSDLNAWLNCESFRPILARSLAKLVSSEPIRVIIQTDNWELRRLPWHLWDFFELYPQAEVALSAPNFEKVQNFKSVRNKLRILAILGNNEGINIEADRKFLESLPRAEIVFLVEPERRDINDQLWQQNWDILFFAGHSCTKEETGRIYINQTESLTLRDLKHGLSKAIARGLQLAIFNSCDGLGLAKQLEDLYIPQIIVMREPVPDQVAQEFLKYFLEAFAGGESLYLAVRSARERLHDEGLEACIPGVTWLPIICQNPATFPMVWPRNNRKVLTLVGGLVGSLIVIISLLAAPNLLKTWNSFSVYQNPENGIKIKYPANWEIKQDRITSEARFISPQESPSDSYQENILVSVDPLEKPTSLDTYTDEALDRISREFTKDVISPVKTTLANREAREVVYTEEQGGLFLQKRQIWTVKGNKVYIITYTVEKGRYPDFEELAQQIIASFQID